LAQQIPEFKEKFAQAKVSQIETLVNLKFPSDVKDANSLLPMSTEVFRALGNQEITPGQAKILLGTLKDYSSTIAIIDLNQRMTALIENGMPNHAVIEGE